MWSSVSDFMFLRFVLVAYLGTLFLFMGMSACKTLGVTLWSPVEDSYICMRVKVKVLVTQLYPTLCDPMDFSLPGSSVHGILQTRILE